MERNWENQVGFRRHKQTLLALMVAEIILLRVPELESRYGLNMVMALVYFAVTYWFVFGKQSWWLYRAAGIAYVVLVTVNMIAMSFQVPVPRPWYHAIIALLWGLVLAVHQFTDKAFPPLSRGSGPPPREPPRFPD